MAGMGESVVIGKDDMQQLREKLEQAMKTIPLFQKMKNNVELTITNEGLRIELLENEKGMFFESGRQPNRTREGTARTAGGRSRQAAQHDFGRRTHRRQALRRQHCV